MRPVDMPKLSIVIPVFNEEESIPELHRRLTHALARDFGGFEYEMVFVDDGSRDSTLQRLTDLRANDPTVKVIEFSRNFGHHIAITAGLDHANGDYVVMMDSDLQDQPEEIINLYRKLQEGYDVVYGERMEKKFSMLKRANSAVFNTILRRLVDEPIVINSTIFRIMTKQVVENTRLLREHNRFILGIVGWVGFRHASQQVRHGERFAGVSKYRLSHQVALAMNAALSYSTYPLRLITRVGFCVVVLTIVLGALLVYRRIAFGTSVVGWTFTALAVLAIGGIQIITLGMIGEYVGRNYMEDKNRPLYIIKNFLK